MRIKMGQSRPDENSTWLFTQHWHANFDVWSAPLNVIGGNTYYVEFLLKLNTLHKKGMAGSAQTSSSLTIEMIRPVRLESFLERRPGAPGAVTTCSEPAMLLLIR
jgi:hypothetical protein